MKIKQICMMVLCGLGVIPAVQAQTFDKLWKEVEQAEKKSLPKKVIKLTDEIYQKGEKEKKEALFFAELRWDSGFFMKRFMEGDMSKANSTPTMKDGAAEAGVALGTVSKVVNGLPVTAGGAEAAGVQP